RVLSSLFLRWSKAGSGPLPRSRRAAVAPESPAVNSRVACTEQEPDFTPVIFHGGPDAAHGAPQHLGGLSEPPSPHLGDSERTVVTPAGQSAATPGRWPDRVLLRPPQRWGEERRPRLGRTAAAADRLNGQTHAQGASSCALTPGTRQIPLILGGTAPASFERMARWGIGYVGSARSAAEVATDFEQARA